jgi:hypothetical protein
MAADLMRASSALLVCKCAVDRSGPAIKHPFMRPDLVRIACYLGVTGVNDNKGIDISVAVIVVWREIDA